MKYKIIDDIVVDGAAVDLSDTQHGEVITNIGGSLTRVGTSNEDSLIGDESNNTLLGGGDVDYMSGDGGDDQVYGGNG